jgi:hypothetical protein
MINKLYHSLTSYIRSGKAVDYIPGSFRHYNTIFIHVPKCAGSSVSLHLFGYRVGHTSIATYYSRDPDFARDAFKFSFVRHPYLRLWSAYSYLTKGGISSQDQLFVKKHPDFFKSFHALVDGLESSSVLLDWIHFKPQFRFLSVPQKSKHRVYMDFIGKTEFMAEDIFYISQNLPEHLTTRLNLIIKEPLNITNGTKIILDSDLINRINVIYQTDFELFGYEKWADKKSLEMLLNGTGTDKRSL